MLGRVDDDRGLTELVSLDGGGKNRLVVDAVHADAIDRLEAVEVTESVLRQLDITVLLRNLRGERPTVGCLGVKSTWAFFDEWRLGGLVSDFNLRFQGNYIEC